VIRQLTGFSDLSQISVEAHLTAEGALSHFVCRRCRLPALDATADQRFETRKDIGAHIKAHQERGHRIHNVLDNMATLFGDPKPKLPAAPKKLKKAKKVA